MNENPADLLELLFRRTDTQSNIYASALIPNFDVCLEEGLSEVPNVDSLLVVCLKPVPPGEVDRQRIAVHSCLSDANSIRAVSKPVLSNALPPETEVVAMDAQFCHVDCDERVLILSFAYVRKKGESGLCIHRLRASEMQELSRHQAIDMHMRLRTLGKVILPMETAMIMPLSHMPIQVISVKYLEKGELKLALIVALISPNNPPPDFDHFAVFTLGASGEYQARPDYASIFPELRLPCNCQVFYVSSTFFDDRLERITAWGTETGGFHIVWVNADNVIVKQHSFSHSTPITSLKLLPDFQLPRGPPPTALEDLEASLMPSEPPAIHLLVTTSIESTVVYRDPLRRGISLANQILFHESADYDCVTCANFFDLDLDGVEEVMLGTYSGNILTYKEKRSAAGDVTFKQVNRQKVGGPVMALHVADMTGDGVKELAVVTTRGIHVMQYPLQMVIDRLTEAVDSDL